MNEEVKAILEFWPIISAVGIFIITQVLSYLKLRQHVSEVLRGLNGLGQKVRELGKEVSENEIENILRMSEILQRIARVEATLDSFYKPKIKNGES